MTYRSRTVRFQETLRRLTMIAEGFVEGQGLLAIAPVAGLIRQRVIADPVDPRLSVGWRCDHCKLPMDRESLRDYAPAYDSNVRSVRVDHAAGQSQGDHFGGHFEGRNGVSERQPESGSARVS
jgi:hypothetical protein